VGVCWFCVYVAGVGGCFHVCLFLFVCAVVCLHVCIISCVCGCCGEETNICWAPAMYQGLGLRDLHSLSFDLIQQKSVLQILSLCPIYR